MLGLEEKEMMFELTFPGSVWEIDCFYERDKGKLCGGKWLSIKYLESASESHSERSEEFL
jgi:hypothetical protein